LLSGITASSLLPIRSSIAFFNRFIVVGKDLHGKLITQYEEKLNHNNHNKTEENNND